MNPNVAHIVYASDDRFSEILGVSLTSLYENTKDMDDVIVYILDNGISDKNRMKIENLSKKYGKTVPVWIKSLNISEVLSMKVTIDRGSLAQYARLFVSRLLPSDLDRVLYLDCDIIINKSIKALWNLNLKNKTIGALMDAFSNHYRANIDLQSDDIMFNSGVMLIDLTRWKEQKVEECLLNFIKQKNGRIQQGDQGALNAVLSHDTYCFEPCFNSVTIFHDFNYTEMLIYRKPPKGFYTAEQVQKAVNEPHIVHFTSSFLSKRPWMTGCQHRYVGLWLKYKELSPWKDSPLWEDKRNAIKQLAVGLLKKMPRKMMILFTGILQAYVRPTLQRLFN